MWCIIYKWDVAIADRITSTYAKMLATGISLLVAFCASAAAGTSLFREGGAERLDQGTEKEYRGLGAWDSTGCEERPLLLTRLSNGTYTTSEAEARSRMERMCTVTKGDFQFRFVKATRLSQITMDDRENSRFVIFYKNWDGKIRFIRRHGRLQIFKGTNTNNGTQIHALEVPIYAAAIRIKFLGPYKPLCIHLRLLGCYKEDDRQRKTRGLQRIPVVLKRAKGPRTCSTNVLRDCPNACIWYRRRSDGCPSCLCRKHSAGIFEGDIRLQKRSEMELMQLLTGGARSGSSNKGKWPKDSTGSTYTIPYVISPYVGKRARRLIREAAEEFEQHTCVRLRERKNETKYVRFLVGSGCWSDVGINPEGNEISIGRGCDKKGTVIHEVMHTVGFWHEHSRPDRDDHVQIVYENIAAGDEENFRKFNADEVENYDVEYDVKSVMHYDSVAFSKNGLPTMVDKSGHPLATQNERLSDLDIRQINRMYPCRKGINLTNECRDKKTDCSMIRPLCDSIFLRKELEKDCPATCGYC